MLKKFCIFLIIGTTALAFAASANKLDVKINGKPSFLK